MLVWLCAQVLDDYLVARASGGLEVPGGAAHRSRGQLACHIMADQYCNFVDLQEIESSKHL